MKNQFEEEDYVIFYANELRKNPKYFKQQKMLIDSQIKSSKELFQKTFGRSTEVFGGGLRRGAATSGFF